MSGATTVASLLQDGRTRLEAAGLEDAALEAEVLLRHAMDLGNDRAHLIAMLNEPARAEVAARYGALLERRLAREPLAYITGHREFYGLDFLCAPGVLIPRPETELLVDLAMEWLRATRPFRPLIVDTGTGCGALAVALAVHAPDATVVATDVSADALKLARRNAIRHGTGDRIDFVQADMIAGLRVRAHAVVANLPYVSASDWEELQPEINAYEPRGALVGGDAGTELIERLLRQAPSRMTERSLLLCEHGDTQGTRLRRAAQAAMPEARISTVTDMAGLDRVLRVERG